jgi:hypothetical protein
MHSIRQSLAWKEWHEHKWKLVSITAILWCVAALLIVIGMRDRAALGATQAAVLLSIVPMAVFVGAGAAAGEQSHRTLPFLQALPVPMWRVALYKLGFGLVTIIVPLLLTLLLIFVSCQIADSMGISLRSGMGMRIKPDEQFLSSNWYVDVALATSLVAGSLFVWTAAFGVNRKDEISAGAVALVAILGSWLLLNMLWSVLLLRSTGVETARLRAIGVSMAPAGLLNLRPMADQQTAAVLFGLASAAVTHTLLGAWYVRRYGRDETREIGSPTSAISDDELMNSLKSPRHSPITAIVWKQFRESAPVALAGVIGVVGIFLLFVVIQWQYEFPQWDNQLALYADLFARIAIAFGFGIALVAGIGVFLYDVRPGLNAFWRSRPINPHTWFWARYLVALAMVLAVIYLPVALANAIGRMHELMVSQESSMMLMLSAHIAVFAAAAAMGCLVRHAVYAAILSVAFMYLGMLSVWVAILFARRMEWIADLPDDALHLTEPQLAAAMLLNFVVGTLIAWLAVRYDWGRKSRY